MEAPMAHANLQGFFAPGFVAEGRQRFPVGTMAEGMERSGRPIEIADARAVQAAEPLSEAEFFARRGFVLLPHASAVRDWDRDAASIYLPEIEQVIRDRLLPGRRVEIQQSANVLRRGRDTSTPAYAEGVHTDGGLDLDDFVNNFRAYSSPEAAQWWRSRYERDEVAGVIWIDFWRPTNMAAPLEHMPLALCDSASVRAEDIVPIGLTGIAPGGHETRHLALRHHPAQRWYYYPRMTCDEMLAFKLAEFWKTGAPLGNCFHSAFRHPDTPADAEPRQSCEHRVSVVVLRD
jgi:hypothetical protein